MSKLKFTDTDGLTKEQKEELQKLTQEIVGEAKKVVEDYVNNPSAASGSIHPSEGKVKGTGVMVGMDSDYLDEDKEMDGNHYVEFKDGEIDGDKKDKG